MGPDNYWFGDRPKVILDRRGPGVDALIENLRAAVARYPYPHEYRAWPGPNSNTFTAFIAREVPKLGLDLPSNAIGKDFLPGGALFAAAPSGSGFQVSLFGLAGILLAIALGRFPSKPGSVRSDGNSAIRLPRRCPPPRS